MKKYITKECKKHGKTKFVLEGRNYYRCCKCRVDAVYKRRKKLKVLAVEYKGGGCFNCGYNKCIEALEFHHREKDEKEFGIATKGITRSWEKMKVELDKCDLLCSNCHREVHAIEPLYDKNISIKPEKKIKEKKERIRKIFLSNQELIDLYKKCNYNKSEVARLLNVSETAIRKKLIGFKW